MSGDFGNNAAQPTTEQPKVDGSALVHAPTADASAQSEPGEDIASEVDAGPKTTAGEPRDRVNDDEALSPTG